MRGRLHKKSKRDKITPKDKIIEGTRRLFNVGASQCRSHLVGIVDYIKTKYYFTAKLLILSQLK